MPISTALTVGHVNKAWKTSITWIARLAFLALSAAMISSVFLQTIKAPFLFGLLGSAAGFVSIWLIVWYLRHPIGRWLAAVSDLAVEMTSARWLLACFVIGVGLRLAFGLAYPVELYSDEANYIALAKGLAEDGVYGDEFKRSFWPPGIPFFYLPSISLLGWQPWLPLVHNLLLFGATLWVVHRLSEWLLNARAASVAALIITLWPNFILLINWPSKELLAAALLPTSVLLYLTALREPGGPQTLLAACGAGACLGFAALAQPSTALFAVVLLAAVPLGSMPRAFGRWLVVLGFVVLSVMPWSIRNYLVHDEIVPISTNGGTVFLSANNPRATGGWIDMDFPLYREDEVAANRQAFRDGLAWIASDPVSFVKLIPIKVSRYFGDDSYAAFRTFRHEAMEGRYDEESGLLFEWISDTYWYAVIILITAGAFSYVTAKSEFDPRFSLILGGIWYFIAVHAIFQSESKHHLIVVGFLAIAASALMHSLDGDHEGARRASKPAPAGA